MKPNKTLAILLAASLAYTSGTAVAGRGDDHYDYAKVVSATPITRVVHVSRPEQQCWQEQVTYHDRDDGNIAGVVLGGIVGGVVGNHFGKGNGNKAMTAVGAVTGAAVGHHLSRGPSRSRTAYEERCETVQVSHSEERIVGYDVHYRYNGRDYYTRTDRDPGSRIRVRVSVTPVL